MGSFNLFFIRWSTKLVKVLNMVYNYHNTIFNRFPVRGTFLVIEK